MFAKVSNGAVIKTSDGTTQMQEYGWKTLRELSRPVRIADGWYDFVQANMSQPAFGFHSGGTSITIDDSVGTVTETQNPDIPMESEQLNKLTADKIKDNIDKLWNAAHDYEYIQINGTAIGLLTIGVIQGLPISLAIKNWSKDIWTLYYIRKSSMSISNLDLDFSSCGPMPYSIPELMNELGV